MSLLKVENLSKHFPVHGGVLLRQVATVFAVDDISFEVGERETLGLVGESGCGKSTAGRALLRLHEPTSGSIEFDGRDLLSLDRETMRLARRNMQMIFQDPYESLNARHTIGRILEEPFLVHGIGDPKERRERVKALLSRVGMPAAAVDKYPHEFSGGQRQRIGIARATALNPKLIICDEPVSALDVSIQSQILNLLIDLQDALGMSYLFIAHNLAVVKHVSDRIAVMYLGRIVELGPADEIYSAPRHPYTRALLSAIPVPRPGAKLNRTILSGDVPSPMAPPAGCAFHTRCRHAKDICKTHRPLLKGTPHATACHFTGEI